MKRLIASRHLLRCCDYCGTEFNKGDVYYRDREVITSDSEVIDGYTLYECPRCHYKKAWHKERYEKFQKSCKHPDKFVHVVYSYIPGEAVQQPDHFECGLCGKWI